ncbi:phosphatase [Acinetobacter sp. ANC 4558]|uniref:MtnX-like HAD-IB family phosphatase n=1 Tax=Acinetobacter sp. ANC 4558 TaxID=1977876 RepID=UPI000A34A4F2|nr:MtnX-like HAD-IB family phosphatase [Acinetobacter sp. ANC 4558]OTG86331.1 phosphatase [Acinetobacter sp. ANC 4558]
MLPISLKTISDPSLHILCDFDGTISLNDTTDILLNNFAQNGWEEIEEQWEKGIIGSQLCMKKQVELLDMSLEEFHECLDNIELDLGFLDLLQFCNENNIPLTIVSDGLDLVIQYLLQRYHLSHLPIVSNRLIQVSERQWTLQFPNASPLCVAQSGTCKCKLAEQSQSERNIILIGDGRSDFCLAKNADFVFAKASLIRHCEAQDITFQAIHTLSDVSVYLQKLLNLDLATA